MQPIGGSRDMSEVSTFRLYLMRATYLLVFVGLGITIWPGIIHHAVVGDPPPRIASSLLGAVCILAALGIRYPLQMLPLLLFDLLWKSIWLLAVALPLWAAHRMDADAWDTAQACLLGWAIFPIAIPWPYVLANYVKKVGDRWR
ncbi:MAG: hypothetical protein ACHP7P_16750 [Terriglobales bacterium]